MAGIDLSSPLMVLIMALISGGFFTSLVLYILPTKRDPYKEKSTKTEEKATENKFVETIFGTYQINEDNYQEDIKSHRKELKEHKEQINNLSEKMMDLQKQLIDVRSEMRNKEFNYNVLINYCKDLLKFISNNCSKTNTPPQIPSQIENDLRLKNAKK